MFFSNKYVSAQVVHAPTSTTVSAASTQEKLLRKEYPNTADIAAAAKIGQILAERLRLKDIPAVAFELGRGERYHANDVLLPKYVQWPIEERLQEVLEDFETFSGIPNVVGSVYTTHVPIVAPKINVGAYFNKRHTDRNQRTSYSITLQGVVDLRGSFTDVCIGWPGSMSDDRVLQNSALYQKGSSGTLQGSWVVGGVGYPMLDWLLVPYSRVDLSWAQHALNERLMEIQKIGKGAFSRLKGRWKFLQRRTEVKLQELPAVLGACCVLHNVCEQHGEGFDPDLSYGFVDDAMFPEVASMSLSALEARDSIAQQIIHNVHLTPSLFE
ncbi:hypothetical protein R1sor_019007 [Riccia sorocarpa]|uniref:DDE Tnp4 domain-containing protein n=1 Tax=Riccia sorocarpa TaxID=122646 RepID=A0ABD3IF34_9MARC